MRLRLLFTVVILASCAWPAKAQTPWGHPVADQADIATPPPHSPDDLQQQPPTAPAAPAAEPQYPVITFGTLTYLQYDEEIKNRDNFNAFDITRGYINVFADLAKNIKFRITPDVRRVTDSSLSGSVAFRVKYAFVEFDNLLTSNSWLRFGAHQTPWLDFEESINRTARKERCFQSEKRSFPHRRILASAI